jgi:hypothetical protein
MIEFKYTFVYKWNIDENQSKTVNHEDIPELWVKGGLQKRFTFISYID